MSTTLPEDPIPTPRLPGALDTNKEHEHNPLESASATEPREIAHPVTLKTDIPQPQDAATFRPPTQPHELTVEEREGLEKEAPTQSSLERITTGLGGMVLTAPLAMLEKVAPSFAYKVEDAASTIAHKVQDLTARADEENVSHAAEAPSSSSSAPVIRPGGEVTHSKADAALEKTATTGGDIASSIKDTAKSAAETIKEKVPSVAPSTSTTAQPELMHADASVARSQAAREEAARVTHSAGGAPSTSSAPSISETAHTLAETASHALDTVRSYLPTSLGGQGGSVTSSIPHFTVVSSEDVPTSIEAEGTRKQVVPPEQRESSFEYPQQAEAKAVPVTENVKEVAQVAVEKVRELGNKAAEYLPSAEQQKQTAEQAANTLGQAASTTAHHATNTAAVVGEKASQATEAVKSRLPAAEDVKAAVPSVEDVKSKLPTAGTATKTTPEGTSTSGNKDWPPSGNTPYSTINPAPAKGVGASYNPLPAVTSSLTAAKDVATSTLHTAAYAVQTVEDAADLALHKAEDVAASALHGVENVASSGYQGVKQTVGGVVGATTSVASGAANLAGSAASTTYEGTKHAVGGVVGATTSTAGAVKDTASSALGTASSAASSTYEAAKNTAGQAVGATTSTAEAAKEKVAETATYTTSSAQQTLQSARDNASSAMEATHKSASERTARVEETIHKNAPVNLSQLRGDSAYSESEGGGTATILRDDHKDTVGRGFGMEGVERTEEVEREGDEAAKRALAHEDVGRKENVRAIGGRKENVRAIEGEELLKITDQPDPSTRGKEEERPFDLAAGHNEPAVTSQAATHDPDASVKSHSSAHHYHPSTSTFAGDGNPAGSDRVAGGAQTQSAPLGGTARFVPGQERDARPVEPASTNVNATASRIPVSATGGYADLAGKNLSGSDRVGHEHVGHTGGSSFVPHSSGVKEDKGHPQPLPPDVDFTGSGSPTTYSSTHPHGAGPSTSHRTADSAPPAPAQDQTGRGSPHTYSSSHEYKVPQGSVPLEQARQQQPAQAAQAQGSFQPQSHHTPPQPPQQQHHDSGYHHQTTHHQGGEGIVVGHAKGEEEIQRLEAKEGRKLGEKILGKLHLKH